LVVVLFAIDDVAACDLLSMLMLKIDVDLSGIQVTTPADAKTASSKTSSPSWTQTRRVKPSPSR
jgi:hypothetical protein